MGPSTKMSTWCPRVSGVQYGNVSMIVSLVSSSVTVTRQRLVKYGLNSDTYPETDIVLYRRVEKSAGKAKTSQSYLFYFRKEGEWNMAFRDKKKSSPHPSTR